MVNFNFGPIKIKHETIYHKRKILLVGMAS
jgi:hypothetical protein